MKHLASLSLICGMALSPAAGAGLPNAEREIRHLEELLNDALSTVDTKTIDRLWAEDFVFVAPSGRIANKAQRMAGLKPADSSAPPLISTLDDVQVRRYGTTAVAIVKTTWRGSMDAKSFVAPYVATHVWVRSGASWRLASAHVSQVEVKQGKEEVK
ncbi:MAG: nuclear transport factor 2 family protein [Pseudomonadota bacterium]|nr:nuclear transport factor 2 family protein [Pseudomonadota bacterium]